MLPVPIEESRMLILVDVEMSIPSVFGLSAGALIRIPETSTSLLPLMLIWFHRTINMRNITQPETMTVVNMESLRQNITNEYI